MRREYGPAVVEAVMEDLVRMGYVDDEAYAAEQGAVDREAQAPRQTPGIDGTDAGRRAASAAAKKALDAVYDAHDSTAVARQLAEKKAPSLRRLDPMVARRRLVGMLQRRGFDYDAIKPVVDEVLGRDAEE